MGYQIYKVGKRYGGYGVPATCEYPTCRRVIDRGMLYACGEEPFSEVGCDRYFCPKHLAYACFNLDGSDERCDHVDDCDCKCFKVCERCEKGEGPFPYKPERKEWIKHLLKDESWKQWRKNNPLKIEEFKVLLDNKK